MTEIAELTGYSRRWVAQMMKRLQEQNVIRRVGFDKIGQFTIFHTTHVSHD